MRLEGGKGEKDHVEAREWQKRTEETERELKEEREEGERRESQMIQLEMTLSSLNQQYKTVRFPTKNTKILNIQAELFKVD